jgi:hypothetical protein
MEIYHFKEEDNEEISLLFNDNIVGFNADRVLLFVYTSQCPISKALPGG